VNKKDKFAHGPWHKGVPFTLMLKIILY